MKDFFTKYGKYFFIIVLLCAMKEWADLLFRDDGDFILAILTTALTYYFWGLSVGKFKGD
tara:strand:- start:700 stop:879 length:180 start_codon:yes stop_codon:yes gene_type:complete